MVYRDTKRLVGQVNEMVLSLGYIILSRGHWPTQGITPTYATISFPKHKKGLLDK